MQPSVTSPDRTRSRRDDSQSDENESRPLDTPDLIVFSHLRWDWVWQRPQHLVSRLARHRRTWFVEEPLADCTVDEPEMRWRRQGAVTVGALHVPGPDRHLGYDSAEAALIGPIVAEAKGDSNPTAWIYTPLAVDAALLLDPSALVFDVMDDLSAFAHAPASLRLAHRRALECADVVFTGGRSLHQGVLTHRSDGVHLFPSGVETEHYAPAALLRRKDGPRVAGYVGVIDERLDLDLVAGIADRLPDWCIRMVGPVAKIDPASLPQRSNIEYPGAVTYDQLPSVMAGFDVALMPFALNEATRSISPTKTLEYLAAGLPVVSTSVPDVVADYSHVVQIADDVETFTEACVTAGRAPADHRHRTGVGAVLDTQHWDRIAARMASIISNVESHMTDLEKTA